MYTCRNELSKPPGSYRLDQLLIYLCMKGDDMKAVAVFPGTKTVKIVEHEAPRLSQPDQVMLRMLDIGICGTDREICSFEYGTPPPGDDHLVIGHESVAEVVGVGSA